MIDVLDAPLADAMIELRLARRRRESGLRLAAAATALPTPPGWPRRAPAFCAADVRAAMEAPLIARGMSCAYPSIVTPHGEILHSERYDLTLAEGDLLLADVGAETAGAGPRRDRPGRCQELLTRKEIRISRRAARRRSPGSRPGSLSQRPPPASQAIADRADRPRHPPGKPHRARGRRRGRTAVSAWAATCWLDVHDMEDLGDRAGYAAGRERFKHSAARAPPDRDLVPGMAVTVEPGFYVSPASSTIPPCRGSPAIASTAIAWPL